MSSNEIGQLISTLGLPTVLVIALFYFLYKCVWKYIIQQMDKFVAINEELVKTNRQICSAMNIKLDTIDKKVDKIAKEMNT